MSATHALLSGAAGAVALNLVHEAARHSVDEAPHVQRLGMRAIARPMRRMGRTPPRESTLYGWALAGDLVGNALYYSVVGIGSRERAWMRGALLGVLGGVGAVVLPGPLGLGERPVKRAPSTAAMTVAWYAVGGLAAAATYRHLSRRSR